jgi:hypothetical protein
LLRKTVSSNNLDKIRATGCRSTKLKKKTILIVWGLSAESHICKFILWYRFLARSIQIRLTAKGEVEGIWHGTHWWESGLCQAAAVGESGSASGRARTPEDLGSTPQFRRQQLCLLSQCLCSCWVDFMPAIAWDTSDISLQKFQVMWPEN